MFSLIKLSAPSTSAYKVWLHIEKVDIIVNYDVPTKHEFYVHRIGRTGRFDKKGYSLTLICPEDVDRFYNIEFEYKLNVVEIKKD